MEVKDRRYKTVRNLIRAGFIKTFREIFDNISKSVVARDLKTNGGRFTRRMARVDQFKMRHIFQMADLLEVEGRTILKLLLKQREEDRKNK